MVNLLYKILNEFNGFSTQSMVLEKWAHFLSLASACFASSADTRTENYHQGNFHEVYNVYEFMNADPHYIWTTNGTLFDECVMCTVDQIINISKRDVYFWRNYSTEDLSVSKILWGKFEGREREPPIVMYIRVLREEYFVHNYTHFTSPKERTGHAEALLYAERGQKCGVFLNKARKLKYNKDFDDEYFVLYEEGSCELRVKGKQRPLQPSEACMKRFLECPHVGPTFAVYKDFCVLR